MNIVSANNNVTSGQLIIGNFSSASALLLQNLISEYKELNPNVLVVVKEGHYDEIQKWLHDDQIDIALFNRRTYSKGYFN